MSDDGHTTAPGANILFEHYCDHDDENGVRCKEWGCYGYDESKVITLWYCRDHQPQNYRGWPPFGKSIR